MRPCSFCGRRHHEESLRSFRPDCANGDPRPEQTGGRVYICRTCDRKRERFIRRLEAGRNAYGRTRRVAA